MVKKQKAPVRELIINYETTGDSIDGKHKRFNNETGST